MRFLDWYAMRSGDLNTVLCVGLDLAGDHIPPVFGNGLAGLEAYGKKVIDIAASKAAVIKVQLAYYEACGPEGLAVMIRLVDWAHNKSIPVIVDAKKADIGDTMEAYGIAVFDVYKGDAATFVPYLGATFLSDDLRKAWMPWFARGRMVISMVKTSNPESGTVQDIDTVSGQRRPMFAYMADRTREWNRRVSELTDGQGAVGCVVGATYPSQAAQCRMLTGPDVFWLKPGFGAQGAGPDDAVTGLLADGKVMGTVNSSRGITRDSWKDKKTGLPKPGDPLEHVVAAIDVANEALNDAIVRARR